MLKYITIGLAVIIGLLVFFLQCKQSKIKSLETELIKTKLELEYTKMYIEYTRNVSSNDIRINQNVQTKIREIQNSNDINSLNNILNELYKYNLQANGNSRN